MAIKGQTFANLKLGIHRWFHNQNFRRNKVNKWYYSGLKTEWNRKISTGGGFSVSLTMNGTGIKMHASDFCFTLTYS